MSLAIEHRPDYKEELLRLRETIAYIQQCVLAADTARISHKDQIKQAFVELDSLDSSLSYSNIMLHTNLLADIEKRYDNLVRALDKPYFARIDFSSEETKIQERFYIGKTSLIRTDWDIPMVLDWRSPLASIYYDGRLGDVTYEAEGFHHSGSLDFKRQYTINNGKLEALMDIDITTTDNFLQASLGEHKDNRLKEIVSTIQSEQNAIIRAPLNKPLIVQGVAGSGKTTIALHRIAYLIYTYEATFFPENFMILAPNRLFLNYISDVLPELGVDKVIQTTYIDFMLDRIGHKHAMTSTDDKLIKLMSQNNRDEPSNLESHSQFKGSLRFKTILDDYLQDLWKNMLPQEGLFLYQYPIVSLEDIHELLVISTSHLPYTKRLEQLKQYLAQRLRLVKKELLHNIEQDYDSRIADLRSTVGYGEEIRLSINELVEERNHTLRVMKKESTTLIKSYMSQFPKLNVLALYHALVVEPTTLKNYCPDTFNDSERQAFCEHHQHLALHKKIEFEDLAPLAMMRQQLMGFEKDLDIRYVVIDEAQDFSPYQFYALKKILRTDLFTILGDLSQGIHSYRGIKDWQCLATDIFVGSKPLYLTLEQSYRTTIEIMDTANQVLSLLSSRTVPLAKPVVRHGLIPEFFYLDHDTAICNKLHTHLKTLKEDGYTSIAIIAKTPREAKHIHHYLKKHFDYDTELLDNKETTYAKLTVVLPAHLSKGLEFDAVVVVTLKDNYTKKELDIKLLYVAMTRALHRMDIICKTDSLPLSSHLDA